MTTPSRTALFIHGLWLHAAAWGPWLEVFADAGYRPIAPGWPGESDTVEQTRANPDGIAGQGFDDVVDHYANNARVEVAAYDAAVTDWERRRGFERL